MNKIFDDSFPNLRDDVRLVLGDGVIWELQVSGRCSGQNGKGILLSSHFLYFQSGTDRFVVDPADPKKKIKVRSIEKI